MLSANTETVQSKVFLKVVMLILLKVKKEKSTYTCDYFPRMMLVYAGNNPSSSICVKFSRKIVLNCNASTLCLSSHL